MSSEIKVVGNLTGDPELRFTPSGSAVANFTVAETPRKFDRQTNEWKDDGPANYFRCTVWSEYAENVAETLKSGMRVIVTGRLKTQEFKGKDGEKRTSPNNVEVDEVAPSLRYATAVVTKVQRKGGNGGNGFNGGGYNGGGGGYNGGGVANSRPAYDNPGESPF